ncbi:DUF2922 domain-containing protein [Tepidibacillus fermentans]|uniref:DUF2922 family protein n=1 Tax=Tepidibacillus fermentans TaxID=1281767 RepID=A0A4R3KDV2_9BACI|nr:DUF2922 domain-containing protein [Tepidibacillus fermentans]TCS81250.1 DUF2922 family protein [Tepidibacillus fermentans]
MTTKTLELLFQTTEGKSARIVLADPVDPIDTTKVQQVMDLIVSKNIFQFSSGELVAAIDARVVEKTITDLIA